MKEVGVCYDRFTRFWFWLEVRGYGGQKKIRGGEKRKKGGGGIGEEENKNKGWI